MASLRFRNTLTIFLIFCFCSQSVHAGWCRAFADVAASAFRHNNSIADRGSKSIEKAAVPNGHRAGLGAELAWLTRYPKAQDREAFLVQREMKKYLNRLWWHGWLSWSDRRQLWQVVNYLKSHSDPNPFNPSNSQQIRGRPADEVTIDMLFVETASGLVRNNDVLNEMRRDPNYRRWRPWVVRVVKLKTQLLVSAVILGVGAMIFTMVQSPSAAVSAGNHEFTSSDMRRQSYAQIYGTPKLSNEKVHEAFKTYLKRARRFVERYNALIPFLESYALNEAMKSPDLAYGQMIRLDQNRQGRNDPILEESLLRYLYQFLMMNPTYLESELANEIQVQDALVSTLRYYDPEGEVLRKMVEELELPNVDLSEWPTPEP